MDRLEEMRAFVRVAESGSFSAAARDLGVVQSTISKAVASLESRLGVRLLNRNTTQRSLTDAGIAYLERLRGFLDLLDEVESSAQGDVVKGSIRLTAATAFSRKKLVPLLTEFMRLHPGTMVRLVIADGDSPLAAEGIDMAIRVGSLSDSGLIVRRVGTTRRVTVASPCYIEARGAPRRPQDLADHECVIYTRLRRGPRWRYDGPQGLLDIPVRGRFQTDSSQLACDAVLAGFGIGHFPSAIVFDALADGRLERLLPEYSSDALPVQVVFPDRRLIARRTRTLADFLHAKFANDPDLNDATSLTRSVPRARPTRSRQC